MKIGVLIPSEEYKGYAGARIRYGRITPGLAEHDHTLTLEDVGAFDPATSGHDVLLVSKCHDSRALVMAQLFAQRGRLVGIDLFDDYFSQRSDARLVRFRTWLEQIADIADFALCSTPAMAEVARGYRPGIATHVMNDPSPDVRLAELPESLETRCEEARQQRRVRLCWFGIGDNPHFPVGLNDLASFGGELGRIARSGYTVELTVLTNARALDATRLEMVAQLPVPTRIEEWSEARETELLRQSLAAFIPVNAQGFSAAKSLNRAVTALNAGCQVIATGFPLYAALDALVYRDIGCFLADLDQGHLRLSSTNLPIYAELMVRFASPQTEAASLAGFLAGLTPRAADDRLIALVHGFVTNGEAHKRVQASGGLSVCSPFSTAKLGFDVVFDGEAAGEGLAMLVSEKAKARLRPELRDSAAAHGKIGGRRFWRVPGSEAEYVAANWPDVPLPLQLASYRRCMEQVARAVEAGFGPLRMIWSESSPLPFAPPVHAVPAAEAANGE